MKNTILFLLMMVCFTMPGFGAEGELGATKAAFTMPEATSLIVLSAALIGAGLLRRRQKE